MKNTMRYTAVWMMLVFAATAAFAKWPGEKWPSDKWPGEKWPEQTQSQEAKWPSDKWPEEVQKWPSDKWPEQVQNSKWPEEAVKWPGEKWPADKWPEAAGLDKALEQAARPKAFQFVLAHEKNLSAKIRQAVAEQLREQFQKWPQSPVNTVDIEGVLYSQRTISVDGGAMYPNEEIYYVRVDYGAGKIYGDGYHEIPSEETKNGGDLYHQYFLLKTAFTDNGTLRAFQLVPQAKYQLHRNPHMGPVRYYTVPQTQLNIAALVEQAHRLYAPLATNLYAIAQKYPLETVSQIVRVSVEQVAPDGTKELSITLRFIDGTERTDLYREYVPQPATASFDRILYSQIRPL